MKKLNSVHLEHSKHTDSCTVEKLPLPKLVKIPMSMHMGAPCNPLVKVKDEVLVGQKIGDTDAFMSAPIHSSVSGKVKAITDYLMANGRTCKMVEIETDGNQTISSNIKPINLSDKSAFLKAVRESGAVGLGGAGFPTHIKLNPKNPIDFLVVNGAECEPYITSDNRLMIEHPNNVINGIKMVMKVCGIPKAIIGIEENKPEAISKLKELTKDLEEIEVRPLPSTYPQGAEKVLIYNTTGRIVAEGELPSDQGVIVMNVSTAGFLHTYFETGMPLVERTLTIDGSAVKKPCNVTVPLGTPIRDVLEYAQADIESINKLIMGGPMMGMCVYSIDSPVIKMNNAILGLNDYVPPVTTDCIKCGRCIKACPFNLMPREIELAYKTKNVELLQKLKVNLCMNCGSCTYVCPAKRPLAETNQLAKGLLPRK
ncbi:MAG: electron transport complex subunit RsxC [Oscillospiraceae bacterium]